MQRIITVTSALLLTATIANAQTDFSTLKLHVGDSVFVRETPDVEIKGRVLALSPTQIELDSGRTFTPATTLAIDRRGDRPGTG